MRLRPLALTVSGVLIASSGCSDATGPSSLAAPAGMAASKAQSGLEAGGGSPTSYQVTIDPRRKNVLRFGRSTLTMPPRSVCRLEGSGYGISVFDAPCAAEENPVTIRATVSVDAQGRQRIDLQPQMRFDPANIVVLSTYVGEAALLSGNNWRIFFCPGDAFTGCVDESLYDKTLTTQIDIGQGLIFRRIKHFSGYLAAES